MRPRRRRIASGFTLIELLVALFVTVEIIIAVLMLFDLNNKLARVQTNVAEMQQSQRIAQYDVVRMLRMTGRGAFMSRAAYSGSPKAYNSLVAGVLNNVTGDVGILGGSSDATNPKILPGTDVLRIRGVISTPVYQINTVNPAAFTLVDADDNGIPESGQLVLSNISPTGVTQDLRSWVDLLVPVAEYRPEALLLASPLSDDIYAVVQMDPGSSSISGGDAANPTEVTIAFLVEDATSPYDAAYNSVNPLDPPMTGTPRFPRALATAASVGILEEYRYYIREVHVDPTDPASDLAPRLSRARVFPGTSVAYGPAAGGAANTANLSADIADNIFDLQVAVGLDTNNDSQITEASPPAADDDWLFNVAADDPETPLLFQPLTPLYYLRITTLALTDRRDPKYSAPLLGAIEDHDYTANTLNTSAPNRMFRHRLMQTQVDLRNY